MRNMIELKSYNIKVIYNSHPILLEISYFIELFTMLINIFCGYIYI